MLTNLKIDNDFGNDKIDYIYHIVILPRKYFYMFDLNPLVYHKICYVTEVQRRPLPISLGWGAGGGWLWGQKLVGPKFRVWGG